MNYINCKISLTTKHNKEKAMRPAFKEILSADIICCDLDTDTLGTFSGEVPRNLSAEDCARFKCEWGMNQCAASYGLASEGSFGPHPFIPFFAMDHEILYFIDRKRGFYLCEALSSEKTNYQMQSVNSLDELMVFADKASYPSHGLIVRPNIWDDKSNIFKGIKTPERLEEAFDISAKNSLDAKISVETDMRAHMNPSRMSLIAKLAEKLAHKLKTLCPKCKNPGWGNIRLERGLECAWCGQKTELVKTEVFGCPKCDYQEVHPRADGLIQASPGFCCYCNP